jgi:hypothetical protein
LNAPDLKVSVPFGVPAPVLTEVASVTESPKVDGLSDEFGTAVVVTALLMIWATEPELPANFQVPG